MKKPPTEHWTELLEHISSTWRKKKGRNYPFIGQDLKLIKLLRNYYTAAELFALWECYLARSPFWGPKCGYLVSGFWSERSVLLDDPNFKTLTRRYEAALGLKKPEEIASKLQLTAKSV